MIAVMFRIFPSQSGIVAIMSRQLIRHCGKNSVFRATTLTRLFLAIVVVLVGLSPSMPMAVAAEYIVEDRQTPAPTPRQRTPRTAPDPSQLASGALSFDGLVGEESTQSILQPIAEGEEDDRSWSSEGASVSVIDDAEARYVDDLESEWVVSGDSDGLYAPPACDTSSAWDWTHGFNTWGNACKNACGHMNLLHSCKKCCNCCRPGCWTGRVDAVFMWRNAPYERALVEPVGGGATVLDANQLESTMAAGPRIQLFHRIGCGSGIEFGYLRAFNFRSQRTLTPAGGTGYQPVSIFPATPGAPFTDADINLGSGIQTFEVNSRTDMGHGNVQFICGIRWLEWQESFTMNTTDTAIPSEFNYGSRTMNSLYGGQIGIDALLYSNNWLRVESVLKGGAYYNLAVGQNTYSAPANNFDVKTTNSPDLASFVGELGFTGVVPLTRCLDFRFGYLAYWLEGIAQPTRQLSSPVSTTGEPLVLTNGGTVVQGVTIGLEGRW